MVDFVVVVVAVDACMFIDIGLRSSKHKTYAGPCNRPVCVSILGVNDGDDDGGGSSSVDGACGKHARFVYK